VISYDVSVATGWLKEYRKERGGTSDYAIARADNTNYQVKFNISNPKEFIAHYVASIIGVPVPSGKIIQIDKYLIDDIKTEITGVLPFKSGYYFGVEWYDDIVKWFNYDEFISELFDVSNYEKFLSIYSYDQYLRNYDRHANNHLIVKNKNKKTFYNSIDADRIFAGYEFKDILLENMNYNCHYPATHGKILYDIIEEFSFNEIFNYSMAIGKIEDMDIDDMVDICVNISDMNKTEAENLEIFLKGRKENIYNACVTNVTCYKNLKSGRMVFK